MQIEIIPATLNDLPEILALQKSAYFTEAEIYHDYSIPPLHQTIDSIKEEFENGIILKAVYDNEIIGSVRAYKEDAICFIGKLIVKDSFQNKGIGKRLMNSVEDCFQDCQRYELFTGIKSLKNISLYEKLGYQKFREQIINENLILVFMGKRR